MDGLCLATERPSMTKSSQNHLTKSDSCRHFKHVHSSTAQPWSQLTTVSSCRPMTTVWTIHSKCCPVTVHRHPNGNELTPFPMKWSIQSGIFVHTSTSGKPNSTCLLMFTRTGRVFFNHQKGNVSHKMFDALWVKCIALGPYRFTSRALLCCCFSFSRPRIRFVVVMMDVDAHWATL